MQLDKLKMSTWKNKHATITRKTLKRDIKAHYKAFINKSVVLPPGIDRQVNETEQEVQKYKPSKQRDLVCHK